MHRRWPVVEISPIRQRDTGTTVIIIVWGGCTEGSVSGINDTAVGIVLRPQILPHPALGADFHGVIDIAVIVRHRGEPWTGLCVARRLRIKECHRKAA